MFMLFVWLVLCVLSAVYADKKGRGPGRWLLFSIFLTPVAALLVLFILPVGYGGTSSYKRCHQCGQSVLKIARKCNHCQSNID